MAMAKHHTELELCLNANDEWHVLAGKCPLDPLVALLVVEDQEGVLSDPHSHALGIIAIFHVQIFVNNPHYVPNVIFTEEAVSRWHESVLGALPEYRLHMHAVYLRYGNTGEVEIFDKLANLRRVVFSEPEAVPLAAAIVNNETVDIDVSRVGIDDLGNGR